MMNSAHSEQRSFYAKKERGVATLFISFILLALMSLTAFFVNRTLVIDQEVAGNYYRADRAQMAAQTGLDVVQAQLNTPDRSTFIDGSGNLIAGPHNLSSSLGSTANTFGTLSLSVTLTDISPPGETASILAINSLGCWKESGAGAVAACDTCSTSCPANAEVSETVAFRGALTGVPSAPLTAKGDISLNSAAITVTNTEGPSQGLTIHAGGAVTASSSNLESLPGRPSESSVASGDDELSSISTDDFFLKFFGQDKDTYKENADYQITCGGVCNTSVSGKQGAIIWVDVPPGDSFTINSNTTVGSAANPVILIVNGNLELRGTASIYGLVYSATTNWNNSGGGTSQVLGAAISEGDFEATGTPNPTYDSSVLQSLANNLGNYYKIPGSWRDF
ncbi:PilX N-terminal domain-containing pilus assembly protein [Neptunomonas sp.]|uniref:PilX N-terminal domain-containing pilus assembly protein n=1 Tax=Neptunomonas sp. TaxID=1971898 RepID=UPI0035634072